MKPKKSQRDELKIALEIQKRHKRILEKQGISKELQVVIKELSDPENFKKLFKREDCDE